MISQKKEEDRKEMKRKKREKKKSVGTFLGCLLLVSVDECVCVCVDI